MSSRPDMTRSQRIAALRKRKRRDKECRVCRKPAARAPNGTIRAMCQDHLDKDSARKAVRKAKR